MLVGSLMPYQTTICRPVEVDGIGLHHGAQVHLRINPAPPDTGIVFIRTDLDGTKIPASWEYVERVSYATSLMHPRGIFISTTEHLMSVLYSMQIDNAYIELDNIELPILDGSGRPFVQLLASAGKCESGVPRRYLRVLKPVVIESNGKRVGILPDNTFRLRCRNFFDHPLVGEQSLELTVSPEIYAREIAPARTFGFEYELDQLREMGLIRGASLENAICFTREGIANPSGLRFPDECCRHKALDLIGDLALIGLPLLGLVVAEKAGHAMHVALVSQLMSDPSLYEIITLPARGAPKRSVPIHALVS
jgi:UDP-3-O-[3-hydroxymyristoyl] N-acetylglucosamine deacetylase